MAAAAPIKSQLERLNLASQLPSRRGAFQGPLCDAFEPKAARRQTTHFLPFNATWGGSGQAIGPTGLTFASGRSNGWFGRRRYRSRL